MNFNRWIDRWRLRRIIALLAIPLNLGSKQSVHEFARSLEATEIMSRGMKPDASVSIDVTREELVSFIRYMTTLHDSKISKLVTARVALATMMESDETAVGGKKEEVLAEEMSKHIQAEDSILLHPQGGKVKRNA